MVRSRIHHAYFRSIGLRAYAATRKRHQFFLARSEKKKRGRGKKFDVFMCFRGADCGTL